MEENNLNKNYTNKIKKWTRKRQKGLPLSSLSPMILRGPIEPTIDAFNKGTSLSDNSGEASDGASIGVVSENINESIELHDTLNPLIWNEDKTIKEDVYNRILEIADTYIENSDLLTKSDIIDIHLVGSNASFNYSKDSDVDIHIIANFGNLSCDTSLETIANNLEKSSFNKTYDIKIKGMDAELYVEDVNSTVTSNGVYSIYKKVWLKEPKPIQLPDFNNDNEFKKLYNKYEARAIKILNGRNKDSVVQFINDLYDLRKTSIIQDGEYGRGNYVFKELRNNGYLDKLKQHKIDLISKQLTLEELSKGKIL